MVGIRNEPVHVQQEVQATSNYKGHRAVPNDASTRFHNKTFVRKPASHSKDKSTNLI